MIARRNTYSHSASAIFREARARPSYAHAIRSLPRSWWLTKVSEWGRSYVVSIYDDDGYACERGHWNILPDQRIDPSAKHDWFRVRLANPDMILSMAAEEAGLVCRICRGVHRIPTVIPRFAPRSFFCAACEAKSKRVGGVEELAIRELYKLAKQSRRQQHPSQETIHG